MNQTETLAHLLPGAVGITRLRVYDTPAPDGCAGGGPHVHLACTEAYYVLAGSGRVETLSGQGAQEIPLEPGRLVWFSPGVIHRLVNLDGALEILVLMQNAGLPEAGDFVLTFPRELLRDASAYHTAAILSQTGTVYAPSPAAALRRRDLAVEGFLELRARVAQQGPVALEPFYRCAVTLVQPRLSLWQQVWTSGPRVAAEATRVQIEALQMGGTAVLHQGRISALDAQTPTRLGVCGTLGPYFPEGHT